MDVGMELFIHNNIKLCMDVGMELFITTILGYVRMSAWNSLFPTILGYVWMLAWNSFFTTILGYGRSFMKIHAHTVCPKMVHFSIGNIFVKLEVQKHQIYHWI